MNTKTSVAVNEESPFLIEELFFSHTDRKGRILYGNDVFVNVGDFDDFSEIENKPHNIIRHPDMPKAVFKLLWDWLLDDQNIVAYVKNKSKRGRYYWVVALVTPFENGFLSVRLKPTSEIFDLIPKLYEDTLKLEQKTSMENGLDFIMQTVKELGFKDYRTFMITALLKELEARSQALNKTEDRGYFSYANALTEISDRCEKLNVISQDFESEFDKLKYLCMNMLANTERYGQSGNAMSVTSETFGKWGGEIQTVLASFLEKLKLFKENSQFAREAAAIAFLQTEMANFFRASKDKSEKYIKGLDELSTQNKGIADDALRQLLAIFKEFATALKNLNESLLALKIIRLNSRIESAHLPDGGAQIRSTVEGISNFISDIESKGKTLENETMEINRIIKKVQAYR